MTARQAYPPPTSANRIPFLSLQGKEPEIHGVPCLHYFPLFPCSGSGCPEEHNRFQPPGKQVHQTWHPTHSWTSLPPALHSRPWMPHSVFLPALHTFFSTLPCFLPLLFILNNRFWENFASFPSETLFFPSSSFSIKPVFFAFAINCRAFFAYFSYFPKNTRNHPHFLLLNIY